MTQTKEVTTKRMAQKNHSHLEPVSITKEVAKRDRETLINQAKAKEKARRPQPKKKEGKKPNGRSKKKVS